MNDFSNYLAEKPYSCNVEGCPVKFTNEDHLAVHKKRHDMVLNIGLTPKCNTLKDQTPTPSQFIINCEEVGLFQELQMNPFEEKFREAVDAIKAGQSVFLGKSFQSNPPDDTLHTPNVFPHITDMPNLDDQNQSNISKSENLSTCEDTLLRGNISEGSKTKNDFTTPEQASLNHSNDSGISLNVSNIETNSITQNEAVILNVTEGHFVKLVTPDNSQSSCNMVVINNPGESVYPSVPMILKDKIKRNLTKKKIEKTLPLKVPITKCTTKKLTDPLDKFSKFSKNAMKLISKLENPDSENNVQSPGRRPKKRIVDKQRSKESRSEFLARSRAASYRCREKKKMYVLYLEKLNGDLSAAYQNLKLINMSLEKQIRELHAELSKHKNCSIADQNTETTLKTTMELMELKPTPKPENKSKPKSGNKELKLNLGLSSIAPEDSQNLLEVGGLPMEELVTDPDSSTFDVAEVILNEVNEENEIPLIEGNKSSDIITRFNSIGNDESIPRLPPEPYLNGYVDGVGENGKRMYMEHSYFIKNPTVDIDKHFINYKTFKERISTSPIADECKFDALQMRLEKNGTITDLAGKMLLEPKNPPSLILLKPFKKRTLQNKQAEKT